MQSIVHTTVIKTTYRRTEERCTIFLRYFNEVSDSSPKPKSQYKTGSNTPLWSRTRINHKISIHGLLPGITLQRYQLESGNGSAVKVFWFKKRGWFSGRTQVFRASVGGFKGISNWKKSRARSRVWNFEPMQWLQICQPSSKYSERKCSYLIRTLHWM